MNEPRIKVNGKEISKEEWKRQCAAAREARIAEGEEMGPPGGATSSGWPVLSDGLAVHPAQIPQATEWYRQRGANVEFVKDGRMKINDRGIRNAALKAAGKIDRNAGYGDYAGKKA